MTPAAAQPKKRTFGDLTREEAFNIGRVVGAFGDQIRARKLPGLGVVIATSTGRQMPIEELLEHARRMSNTL